MLAPLSWLKEYVEISCTPKELQEKLFSCGFEVEELKEVGADIKGVVVGLVESCEPIPDTHLHVCRVDCGVHGRLQICCGADNVAVGKKFPTALPGATVYETNRERTEVTGVTTIKKGKLRGYESQGMLCSGTELGVSEEMYPGAGYQGLLLLPDEAETGADVKPILGLDDWIFDIAVTANRPDCQSIYGIAREVAAVLDKPIKELETDYTISEEALPGLRVSVEAPELCPRYLAHYVSDVKVGDSPAWMKRRLALLGIHPISNLVDITNYVMLELGQPMHAYDRGKVSGDAICVRRASDGETILTLDGETLTLTASNLLICDAERPIGLAGIMGGMNSEILPETKEVILEAAKFARDNIRRSSRSLGKRTDASARFEKGCDEYTAELAMRRALCLIERLGCGRIAKTQVDVNTGNSIETRALTVNVDQIQGVLGISVPETEMLRILERLHMEPKLADGTLSLKIPPYREDMESYQDVAEEVIRLYGYEHLVPSFLKCAEVTSGGLSQQQERELALKETLCGAGCYECIHYSFFSPADLDMLRYAEDAAEMRAIRILNPISEEISLMRTTLTASMANAAMRNQKNGNLEGRLFEIANVFVPKALPLSEYPDERTHLALAFFGAQEDFYSLKGALDLVAERLHRSFRYEQGGEPFLHPYQAAAVICGDRKIGYLGKLAYDIAEKLSLRSDLYLAELDLKALYETEEEKEVFEPLPLYPEVTRDLALVMDRTISCGQVEDGIRRSNKYVREVKLFDVYEGAPIPPDKKSLAFSVTFRPKEEWKAEDTERNVEKILNHLNREYGITLRL